MSLRAMTAPGDYFAACFLRFAQYAFILRDCARRAAALMALRRWLFVTVGALALALLGGRPLRFVP